MIIFCSVFWFCSHFPGFKRIFHQLLWPAPAAAVDACLPSRPTNLGGLLVARQKLVWADFLFDIS